MDTKEKLCLMVIFLVIVAICGCTGEGFNTNPPKAIKDVGVYNDGNNFVIYYSLLDDSNTMTTSNGKANFKIDYPFATKTAKGSGSMRISKDNVTNANFEKRKVKQGGNEIEVLGSFIRIPLSSFVGDPTGMVGKIRVQFEVPDGKLLESEEDVTF